MTTNAKKGRGRTLSQQELRITRSITLLRDLEGVELRAPEEEELEEPFTVCVLEESDRHDDLVST